jgi:hypothetical protein
MGVWEGSGVWMVNGPSPCALAGCGEGPFVSAWRRSVVSVGLDVVAVECRLLSGEVACPDCGWRLAPWGHAAARFVRGVDGVVGRIRLRRGMCSGLSGCGRSHVLLPRVVLGRRVDVVEVIWSAVRARAGGWGWRRITALVGRPASTVRGWLSRFAAHAEPIRVGFAQVEQWVNAGGDVDRVAPAGSQVADAVAQIGAAVAAVRRAYGAAVFAVSVAQVVAACSGGWLLRSQTPVLGRLWINTPPPL